MLSTIVGVFESISVSDWIAVLALALSIISIAIALHQNKVARQTLAAEKVTRLRTCLGDLLRAFDQTVGEFRQARIYWERCKHCVEGQEIEDISAQMVQIGAAVSKLEGEIDAVNLTGIDPVNVEEEISQFMPLLSRVQMLRDTIAAFVNRCPECAKHQKNKPAKRDSKDEV